MMKIDPSHCPNTSHDKRLDREVEREREQRHKNDEARAGIFGEDDFRLKDARDSNSSGNLQRHRG